MNKLLISVAVFCACALLISAQESLPEMPEMLPQPQQEQPAEGQTEQQPEAERRFWKKHYHYYAGYPAYGSGYGYRSYGSGYRPYGSGHGYRPYGSGHGYRPYGSGYGHRPYGYGYHG